MQNVKGDQKILPVNEFGIVIRPRTKVSELERAGASIEEEIVNDLSVFKGERLRINGSLSLTETGKVSEMEKLRKNTASAMEAKYLPRAEAQADACRRALIRMLAAVQYKGDPSPGLELAKQAEARQALAAIAKRGELVSLLDNPATDDFLFTAALSAPLPMLQPDVLMRLVESKLHRIAPDILDYRDGATELLTMIVIALRRVSSYIGVGAASPDDRLGKINLGVDFVKTMATPKSA